MKHFDPPVGEQPPSRGTTIVFVGKNGCGQWVAREQRGLFGGLFIDRISAMRYALFENGHHPEAIVPVSSVLELDIGGAHQIRMR